MITNTYDITGQFIAKALLYADAHEQFCYICPNQNEIGFKHTLAIGASNLIETNADCFYALRKLQEQSILPIFFSLSYDLKNECEALVSDNQQTIQHKELTAFEPVILITLLQSKVQITAFDPDEVFNDINNILIDKESIIDFDYKSTTSKEEYIQNFEQIKQHIVEGDIYEMNYCINFESENIRSFSPITAFKKLTQKNPSPFSSLFKSGDKYIISSSPERFLKKQGNKVVSQPMKGTSKRDNDPIEDLKLKNALSASEKEKSENLMIVDLVRHDLTKHAVPGSVHVDELFGLYTFPKVHQMISTVSMTAEEDVLAVDIIKAAFPMGSMTGAPKIKAMELIEQYENFKRGIFSGSIGYITPEGDFDLNVLIRTIIFDATNQKLSLAAGSAITYDANANDEYQECLLKVSTLISSLK